MKKTILTLGALVVAGVASAGEPRVFQWSAVDLTTSEGIAETHSRIEATADRYCRDYLRGTRGLRQNSQCVAAVTDEILLSVNDPQLTAYARSGARSDELMAAR